MARPVEATVLHADLDAFYASVEQLLDPSLRDRPIAVGGGVVLAASYEARAYGVSSGMAAAQARRLCPGLHFVEGHFAEYERLAERVMDVLRSFTPWVERVSIDEAFADVRGARRLFGSPLDIATAMRRRVHDDVGLALSIGIARTKHLAKVASQVAKPDGLVAVEPGSEEAFLHALPVELLWGVGPATRARLAGAGIHTVGELARVPGGFLERLLGTAVGATLGALAADRDPRVVGPARPVRSMGAQAALGRRPATDELVRTTVAYLADRVGARLRAAGRAGRTVGVRVRFPGLRTVSRSVTVAGGLSETRSLTEVAHGLVRGALRDHPSEHVVTLLAVAVSNLVDGGAVQLELPLAAGGSERRPGTPRGSDRGRVDRSVDAVRDRFGRHAVDYLVTRKPDAARVPEAFRALAERDARGD